MSVLVAPLKEEHFAGFCACLDAVCREEKYLAFLEAPPRQEVETFLRELMTRHCPQFVALNGGRVVGWIDINVATLPGHTHTGRLGMGLLPEYRGIGIGRRLLESALDAAKRQSLTRIELQVFASNETAIRLYERAGFTREGRRVRARILHGVPDDVIDMALLW